MRQILCDNPRIIIHPQSCEKLYQWKTYVFRGELHHVTGRCFSVYSSNHNFFFNVKKHNITLDDVDECYVLNEKTGEIFPLYLVVPCGHCDNCIKTKQNSYVHRCHLETQNYLYKPWFITLTYDDEHVPRISFPSPIYRDYIDDYTGQKRYDVEYVPKTVFTLNKRDVQLFLKRLRVNLKRHYKPQGDEKIRYTVTGEYGKNTRRPHYHLIVWNLHARTPLEYQQLGKIIEDSWNKGYITYRLMNPDKLNDKEYSYTCKYLFKDKARSKLPEAIEELHDFDVPADFQFPYHCSSNRFGGIGTPFLMKYKDFLSHPHSQFLDIWKMVVQNLQFSKFVIDKLFPSYSQLVPPKYRQAIRDVLYYDVYENPLEDTMYQDILEEFNDSLTYIPSKDVIPMNADKLKFSSSQDCLDYIYAWRKSSKYVAPSEAKARHLVREEFLLHNFSGSDITPELVKKRSYDARQEFNRQLATEIL